MDAPGTVNWGVGRTVGDVDIPVSLGEGMGEVEEGDAGTTQVGGEGDVLVCSAGGDELIIEELSSLVSATE